jgi:hypothetical protein
MENKVHFHESADEQYRSAVNERLRALARTYEACVAIDMDSRVIGVNDNYLKLVEKDRDEIWNKPILEVAAHSRLPKIIETGEPQWFYPLVYKIRNEKKYIVASGHPLRDGSNRVIGAIGFVICSHTEPLMRLLEAVEDLRDRPVLKVKSVFISHARQDRRLIRKLIEELHGHGISTFPSTEDLEAGPDWQQQEIEEAIKLSNAVIVLVDPKHQPDDRQRFEWSAALEEAWKDPRKRLIPLLLGNAELPSFLSHRQALRVRDPKKEWGRAVAELIRVLENNLTEPGEFVSVEQEDPSKRSDRLREIEEATQILKTLALEKELPSQAAGNLTRRDSIGNEKWPKKNGNISAKVS